MGWSSRQAAASVSTGWARGWSFQSTNRRKAIYSVVGRAATVQLNRLPHARQKDVYPALVYGAGNNVCN